MDARPSYLINTIIKNKNKRNRKIDYFISYILTILQKWRRITIKRKKEKEKNRKKNVLNKVKRGTVFFL